MAIPAILQGDDSGAITIALADGHTYDGATLVVVFNGVSRQYTNLTAGGSVSLVFTAEETAGMPLGTAPLLMRLVGANGGVETVGNAAARIKVTDCVAEVSAGGSFAVTPGGNPLEGVAGLGTRYTGDQLRAKINEVIAKLGGTVAALLLCALPCLGDVLEVQTAPLGGIYSDERVVTNVTFDASAVVPGDYANVSNAAMNAVQQGSRNWMDVERKMGAIAATDDEFIPWCFMGSAYFADELVWPGDGYNYHLVYDESAMRWITWYAPPGSEDMIDKEAGRFLTQEDIAYLSDIPAQQDLSGYATKAYVDDAISTNNAAFVEAVLAAPIAGADPSDLAEIGEYGSYGTVGAAILALLAGLAALKRGKADKTELPYDIVTVTPSNGVVTVGPRTIAIYTAGDSAAAFTVAVGTGTSGKARDCELVIDCMATGAVAPTVTWPATFHPHTDAATDFACETGKRNVYFISEFAPGEFAVGGWQETTGGNA